MATEVQVPAHGAPGRPDSTVEPAMHNYRSVEVVWFITAVVTILIAIRFVLRLMGASTQSGFVTFLYGVTDPLTAPFRAIFPASSGQGSTFDASALVAIVIYALLGWGIVAVIKLITAQKGARSVS
ncbi:MAG: YggT family protein [Candidatus Dormibacteria bacterium]